MTVQQKYISDIAWSNYISERFSEKFSNIETLIDDEIERIKLNASKPQLKLSEIVLVPGQARSLEATQALAEEMIAAIKKGRILPKLPANILLLEALREAAISAGSLWKSCPVHFVKRWPG